MSNYIKTPIKPDEVIARVSVQLQIALAQKKLKKTNEVLQKQTGHGTFAPAAISRPLTFLPGRLLRFKGRVAAADNLAAAAPEAAS